MANKNRSGERERFWRGVLARFGRSGQQVREFCREARLSEPSFYAWRRTIAQRDGAERAGTRRKKAHTSKRPAFLPVMLGRDAFSLAAPGISVEIRGGRTLRLPESIPAERLAAIIVALEATEARS